MASQSGSSIGISVNVIANSVVQSTYQSAQLQITSADVAQGYVDAVNASRFLIRTNSRKGYLMSFAPSLDIFHSVRVSGSSTLASLGAEGGVVVQRGTYPSSIEQELSFRFYLHASVQPGSYPWPLTLSIHPLE